MSVLVLAEHDGKSLKQSTLQAVTAAGAWQQPIDLLVYGQAVDAVVAEAEKVSGVARVLVAQADHFLHPLAEDVSELTLGIAANYSAIVSAHTAFGKSVLPGIGARLDVASLSDVVQIQAPATYVRPCYAGNIFTTLVSQESVQVITVRATSFRAAANEGNAEVVSITAPAAKNITRWVSESHNHSDRPELGSARVVIAGGRSLAERFNELLEPIAEQLDAAIGATRACVDAGYAPNDIQVGQTGTIIAPELYIAVGISGAMQHLAGIKDSKIIVAINHDPDAPIFKHADYGLVADLFTTLPALNDALRNN